MCKKRPRSVMPTSRVLWLVAFAVVWAMAGYGGIAMGQVFGVDDPSDMADSSGDIKRIEGWVEDGNLNLTMTVYGVFAPSVADTPAGMTNRYYYHWLLDTDNNPNTGYHNSEYEGNETNLQNPIGVDLVVQFGWRDGNTNGVYAYDPLTEEALFEDYNYTISGDTIHAVIPLADLGLTPADVVALSAFQEGASDDWKVDWMESVVMPLTVTKATNPIPPTDSTDISRDVILGWTPGASAATHNVTIGTDWADVNDATVATAADLDVNSFDPGRLDFGQTYYWRVDEVNGAPDFAVFKGDVWNFTTEPFAYPIEGITVTSNTTSKADEGVENIVNGSGLNELGEHSTRASEMWLGSPGGETPWLEFDFDRVYKLHEIDVWNYNVEFELVLGFGIKDITVEYSEDGVTWTTLGDVELAQGTAKSDYTANTTIDFGGLAVKSVRFTINGGFGAIPQYGLSEVRFLYIPAHARYPEPADGATEVDVDVVVSWRAGREAASHEVYLSTDEAAVADGTALVDTVDTASLAAGPLDLGTMYYWKVDEVNEAEAVALWEGTVWSFMTQEYAVIDDFESYGEDEGSRVYDVWIDGWTNETGSVVGYLDAPFVEKRIVNSGEQSMPLEYNNADAPFYSEASRSWSAGQDWTAGGADSFRLHLQGNEANDAETLYVAIEDRSGQVAVVTHADPQAVTVADWQEWVIPLSVFGGVDLTNVETVYIGVGSRDNPTAGGSGTIIIDDIGFGKPATAG